MIIKSMSRKEASFAQLVDYMEDIKKADQKYHVYSNVYHRNSDGIQQEFKRNSQYLKQRKGGVYLYHEILSITKTDELTDTQHKEKLYQIAHRYLNKRAQHNMAYGVLHDDNADNLHYHLMISSNEVGQSKRHRLSKHQFDRIKKDLENRVLKDMPELKQGIIINKVADKKLSKKGAELKRRTGKTTQRQQVIDKLKRVFQASNKQDFFNALTEEKLEIYTRGKSIGILDQTHQRKHRIKTLGLEHEFHAVSELLEAQEKTTSKTKQKQPEKKENAMPLGKIKEPSEQSKEKASTTDESESTFTDKVRDTAYQSVKATGEAVQDGLYTAAGGRTEKTLDDIARERMEEMQTIREQKSSTEHTDKNSR